MNKGYVKGKNINADYSQSELKSNFDLMPEILEKQGFDGLPQVVSVDELDEYIKENNTPVLWRGIGSNDKDVLLDYSQQFKEGDVYISGDNSSLYGRGIYTTTRFETASKYANIPDSNREAVSYQWIDKMTLDKNAKILEIDGNSKLFNGYVYGKERNSKLSNYAISHGYDAIQAKSITTDKEDYFVILNRTAVLTDGENHFGGD